MDELCRQCNIEKRRLEDMTSTKFPDDFCIRNRQLPKEHPDYGCCKYPMPELNLTNKPIWNLFEFTYGAPNAVGMDGVERGKRMSDVRDVADALEIPWDQTTIEKFVLIEAQQLADSHRRLEAARKKK